MSRLFILLAGLGAMGIATLYIKTDTEGVLETVFSLYAIFSGGIAGIFILGVFSKRANKKGLYTGIAACVIFTAWALLTSVPLGAEGEEKILLDMGKFNFRHHNYMIGVYSHLVVIVVGYLASFLFRGTPVDISLTWYGRKGVRKESVIK
jgi:SSS family solute:Na+ symporter